MHPRPQRTASPPASLHLTPETGRHSGDVGWPDRSASESTIPKDESATWSRQASAWGSASVRQRETDWILIPT